MTFWLEGEVEENDRISRARVWARGEEKTEF
jgi:hypothetical protein